jgi:hypothetical protein
MGFYGFALASCIRKTTLPDRVSQDKAGLMKILAQPCNPNLLRKHVSELGELDLGSLKLL